MFLARQGYLNYISRMRVFRLSLLLVLLISSFEMIAQNRFPTAHFRRGDFKSSVETIPDINIADPVFQKTNFDGRIYTILQFAKIPVDTEKKKLQQEGIELLEYIPDNTFLVSVSKSISRSRLKELGVVTTISINPLHKTDALLNSYYTLDQIQNGVAKELLISGFPDINNQTLIASLSKFGFNATEYKKGMEGTVKLSVSADKLMTLADLPFIYFIEEFPGEEQALNDESGTLHGTNLLANSLPGVGRNLTGKGVVIGVGDMGGTGIHPDHNYKTISFFDPGVYHSLHVTGIAAGAGLLNPRMKGRAPKAITISHGFADIITNTPQLYQSYGMVLTNNSYGTGAAVCRNFGSYNSNSKSIDQQMLNYPEVLHVMAAGNEVTTTCAVFPAGYHTVFGAYQAGKNGLTVGGSFKSDRANVYSKGPTNDGRLKPEITSIGRDVFSTVPIVDYGPNNGTSMAAPQVTGTLALLVERYRQLNNGTNPKAALMKAIICNAADDIGTSGPDFANGFGFLNALPAVRMLEDKTYFTSTIQQQQQQSFSFTVGNDRQDIRIMLCWPDRPGSLYALQTLVNDLDISVTSPNGTTYKPLVLDTAASAVLQAATSGEDHINNMEQIVIRNPAAGNYTINIKGYAVPFGPQEFFVCYYATPKEFLLLNPVKKDKWKAGEKQLIAWIQPAVSFGNYNVEFSADGTTNWQSLGTVTGNNKSLSITVPNIQSTNAALRLTNTTTNETVVADSLIILPEVTVQLVTPCDGYIRAQWNAIAGVDSFSVYMAEKGEMQLKAVQTNNSILIGGLNKDSAYWIAVAPWKNGIRGERSVAAGLQPLSGICSLDDNNGDIAVLNFISPLTGRKNTSTERAANEMIQVTLKNIDDDPSTKPIILKLFVNNNLFEIDTLKISVPGSSLYNHAFSRSIDLRTVGEYRFKIIVEKADDAVLNNNVLEYRMKVIANDPITVPFEEKFNTLKDTTYNYPGYLAIDGAEAWDFSSTNKTGRLRTKLASGNRALIAEKIREPRTASVQNTLTATYNMSAYSLTDNLFVSVNTDSGFVGGTFFVRGSDTSKWLPLYNFDGAAPPSPQLQRNITKVLRDSGQKFSSSFQFKIDGTYSYDYENNPQTYLKNLKIYRINNDVAVWSIGNNASIYFKTDTLTVRYAVINNSSGSVSKLPLTLTHKFNGILLKDTVQSLRGYDSVQRFFKIPVAKLTSSRTDSFFINVEGVNDEYLANNSIRGFITVTPIVDSFPYLDGFETGTSLWSGNLFYLLTGHEKEKYANRAANGKYYFYPNNDETLPIEPRQMVTTSVGIDLSKMRNPYISFSSLRYLRPGRDSSFVQISYNGTTFRKLTSTESYNWYNFKNNTCWSDSSQLYWNVVTSKIPDTNKKVVLIRIFTNRIDSTKYPIWSGGLGVDDIHIYDLTYPILNTASINISGDKSVVQKKWQEFTDNGNLFASIYSQNSSPFDISWQLKNNIKPVQVLNGRKILSKRWVFKSAKTIDQPAKIRLYFTDQEANLLRVMNSCDKCVDTSGAYDFNIYQYTGPGKLIDHLRSNNITDNYRVIPANDFDLVPYDKGYYAEFTAKPEGEFYIQMPERYAAPAIQFAAQPESSTSSAIIAWNIANSNLIDHIELEQAIGDEAYEEGSFNVIANKPMQSGDQQLVQAGLQKGTNYYYRLKLVYKNGYSQYSMDQVVSLEGNYKLMVYPNPSSGIFNVIVPQYYGADMQWQLSNGLGQVIMKNANRATGNLTNISINLSSDIYPAGVYFLKIKNGTNSSVIKLVKE